MRQASAAKSRIFLRVLVRHLLEFSLNLHVDLHAFDEARYRRNRLA
jgi:hypothetical protein